jgi:hypothetical protein
VAIRQIRIQPSLLQKPLDFRMSKYRNLLIGKGPLDSIMVPAKLFIVIILLPY